MDMRHVGFRDRLALDTPLPDILDDSDHREPKLRTILESFAQRILIWPHAFGRRLVDENTRLAGRAVLLGTRPTGPWHAPVGRVPHP